MRFNVTAKSITLWVIFSVGSMCFFASTVAMAGNLYVIAYPGVELTEAELKEMYMGERQFSGSTKLVPVDNAAAQSEFLSKVMGIDAAVYASLWIKKAFRAGLTAPQVKSGDAETLNFIHKTPGAVGYVTMPKDGQRVMLKY